MTAPTKATTYPCNVAKCDGTLEVYRLRSSEDLVRFVFQFQCNRNWRHRADVLFDESKAWLSKLFKRRPGRWDGKETPLLQKEAV